MAAPSDPSAFPRPPLSPNNHIDLTLDDDDDIPYNPARYAKRPRIDPPRQDSAFFLPASSTMSTFPARPHDMPSTSAPLSPSSQSPFSRFTTFVPPPQASYRPPFAGPPQFLGQRLQLPTPISPPSRSPSYQLSSQQSQSHAPRPHSQPTDRQVIDLTGSPSPPPQPPTPVSRHGSQPPLPPELPPKTPVCIGQLTVTALVLYPVAYLTPQNPGETEWAVVRLHYDHNAVKNPNGGKETIHIKTPSTKGPNGETIPGDVFGVVEQKVADFLGPMLGKGLIRLDAKVRKGAGNLPILPLQMIVHTPKGNIEVVGNYLRQSSLILSHPTPPFDPRLSTYHYYNPHYDLLDNHNRPVMASNSLTLVPRDHSRWTTASSSTKSVEVQRSQVDELFKTLKDGDELMETEAAPEVATKLYPHQKKALTFLLEREREKYGADGFSSLWQKFYNPMTHRPTWRHLVTLAEVHEPPREAKGAILADDMGLGKTITCVSLIAATLDSSRAFAASPNEIVPPPPPRKDAPSAAQFAGSVWGMPDVPEPSNSHQNAKAKAKAEKLQEKLEAEYARSCRIKTRSRATLIVCPLSTVSNWEDQFREHWKGEVSVIGGNGGACVPPSSSQASSSSQIMLVDEKVKDEEEKPIRVREGMPLRVYIYHGNARRPDPSFLADFDAVITTYATLASEFSKQSRSLLTPEDEEEDGADSDQGGVDIDDNGNQVLRLPKSKKGGVKRKKAMLAVANNPAEIPSALQSIHWFRVVLDEAHCIKETGTVASRACCDLMADRRLCLTGTPVQNKLDDVFALIKFLRLEPFNDKNIWTEYIGSPVKFAQALGVARLQTIMKCITLRRTKESKAPDGKRILALPPRRDELRYLKFDEQEQDIYNRFFTESRAEFNDMTQKNEVMKNYVGILQKILRLRQICDHFELVEGKEPGQESAISSYDDVVAEIAKEGFSAARAAAIFAILKESATTQCVECGGELCVSAELNGEAVDSEGPTPTNKRGRRGKGTSSRGPTRASSPNMPRPVLTRCQHLFCIECYRNSVCPGWPNVAPEVRRSCSACQTGLCPTDSYEVKVDVVEAKKKPPKREKRQKGASLDNFHPSTKVKALLGDLVQFSRENPHSVNYDPEIQIIGEKEKEKGMSGKGVVKTVVFSQWTSMLDKIEDALEAAGIRFDRLDGTMKRDDRTRAMDALKYDPGCEVLLVSLKAGGVGLNLTAAQRVYLMDPYWNPAVENQAVDRIHRLGQTRPVTTVKFIIENSIEARLLEVQKKKTELANMTLGQNFSKADLAVRRMEELNQLFNGS
ncbi:hypothetical protein BDN70DRAFT_878459 [Pholiota conissans]|uniref:SNF2 family DNA-dependent ATPase n=1 Tax=Pholiota conissans TaxID=109636 RepID=A0A9P6D0U3_9AGAR|nr:hypothetical protein BDN70DRAFT_878459 [Pholiota conissans]